MRTMDLSDTYMAMTGTYHIQIIMLLAGVSKRHLFSPYIVLYGGDGTRRKERRLEGRKRGFGRPRERLREGAIVVATTAVVTAVARH